MIETMLAAEVAEVTHDRILDFLDGYRIAYETGDKSYFSFFASDASFFTISSATRIDSLEEFHRSFGPSLADGAARRCQFMAPEVRVMGNSAVVTCHNRVSVQGDVINLRATFLLEMRRGNLKIVHMHVSPAPLPPQVPGQAGLEEVRLLEERVATAASTVGTPK